MLKRPLWFITEKNVSNLHAGPRRDTFAFSGHDKLMEFMAHSKAGAWDVVKAADRTGLLIVVADAHMRGCDAVYLDPDANGKGGECVYLSNLLMID
jgi:hypothetical protein